MAASVFEWGNTIWVNALDETKFGFVLKCASSESRKNPETGEWDNGEKVSFDIVGDAALLKQFQDAKAIRVTAGRLTKFRAFEKKDGGLGIAVRVFATGIEEITFESKAETVDQDDARKYGQSWAAPF